MKLTFLGAGDMFSFRQGHNSVLVEFNETNLVIDFPETNFKSLRELGKDLTDIKNVFITHLHEDHINGLQLLGNYCRVYAPSKPGLYVHLSLYEQLWQTLRFGMEPSSFGPKSLSDYFDVHIIENSFEIAGQLFAPVKTLHLPGMVSHGLLCKPHFYFTSDSTLDAETLWSIARDVSTIFHECHLQDETLRSHTSLEEILGLPKSIRDQIVLMHYEDRYADPVERENLEKRTNLKIAGPLSVYNFA